ncbi:MAG: tyrosine--tRNA ligase [Nanoarchaeota archaeon]
MKTEEKLNMITRNIQEVIDEEKVSSILKKRDLKIYWGTTPTGVPHLGYFVPLYKIADFLKAGCEVTILFANLHAYLDNMKSTWELLEYRTRFYEFLIKEMLKLVEVPLDKLKFVKGTDFQLSERYTLDMYKLSAIMTTKGAQHAGAEVVKQTDNPKLSGLLYPILQALDEEYLGVDIQFGGVDQRKIFMLSRDFMDKIGYEKKAYLMNPLVPGLGESGKMSSSEPNSKIDFFDTDKQIRKKINKAYCVDGQVEGNGLLALMRFLIFRELEEKDEDFVINRPEQYGGKIIFKSYKDLEKAFEKQELKSIDLKMGVADEIIKFVSPLRIKLEQNIGLFNAAYPSLKTN